MIYLHYGTDPKESVEALIAAAGLPLEGLSSYSKVVIKPNIVLSKKNWLGADTRPNVVEAVICFLKDLGVRNITVADGSGVGNSATEAFDLLGYTDMAKKYGVKLLDIEKDRFVSKPTKISGPFKTLEISRTVADCDFLINIPVLKAHCQTRITCALKNMKGTMPKGMKPKFHSVDLHRSIAQLNTVVTADLILVDGAFGDLSSELGGNPVEMGIMALGTDPLEIDVFAAGSLGFTPKEIGYIRHFAEYRGVDLASYSPRTKKLNRPKVEKQFSAERDPYRQFPCTVSAEGACCTCEGNLIFALKRLNEAGKLSRDQHFVLGRRRIQRGRLQRGTEEQKREQKAGQRIIAVGKCAVERIREMENIAEKDEIWVIKGCPPEVRDIVEELKT
jgi:uncharacterized protein (DUF362 family)